MNISLINKDAVSGVLKFEIVKADYTEQVDKSLRKFRQKANVPGFRKGMVPTSVVKKMYGKHVLLEELDKIVSEGFHNFFRENNLAIIGEPLPSESEASFVDFDHQEDFEFYFDVALAPEFNIELSKNDKAPYYHVAIEDDMIQSQIESYLSHYGSYDKVESVDEKDLVKGTIAELENGAPKEGGLVVENTVLMPSFIKDEAEKAKFIGTGVNTVVVFNPYKAYEGSEAELSSFLKVEKEAVANYTGDFSFEIKEVTRHSLAELNQELFDKIFGENTVTSEEEFRNKIKVALAEQFEPQCDFKFLLDVRELLCEKVGEMMIADDFVKRWFLTAKDKSTPEAIDEDFPKIKEELKYHFIKESLVKKFNLSIEQDDLFNFAKRVAKAQLAQYGMISAPDTMLESYAKEMLNKKDTLQAIAERVMEEKLSKSLREHIDLEIKEISVEEFSKFFN